MRTHIAGEPSGTRHVSFWNVCGERHADIEKAGRSICGCAGRLRRERVSAACGFTRSPLYLTGRAAAEALDMLEATQGRSNPCLG